MKFYDYVDLLSWVKRSGRLGGGAKINYEEFIILTTDRMRDKDCPFSQWERESIARRMFQEAIWLQCKRPYYNVWPTILPMLLRLDLSHVRARDIVLPRRGIFIRLPAGREFKELSWDRDYHGQIYHCPLHGVMVGYQPVDKMSGVETGLSISPYFGQLSANHDQPACSHMLFPIDYDGNFDQCLDLVDQGRREANRDEPVSAQGLPPQEINRLVVKLVATICLMANDPEIVQPDVLNDDRQKYEDTNDEALKAKLIAKALRRGKVGFDIGRNVEMSPHYRRAHPFLTWTGKGRQIPRVVLRKASIVHRDIVNKVPTGNLDEPAVAETVETG